MVHNKILLIVAFNGYQQVEYNETKKVLSSAGFDVVTASNAFGAAVAKDGSTTEVDITTDQVNVTDYKGIFFIGGPGCLENLDNPTSYSIAKSAISKHILLGGICLATRILAHAGVLDKREATGWNGDGQLADIYKKHEVSYIPDRGVVVDGTALITAQGPDFAKKFGEHIVDILKKEK